MLRTEYTHQMNNIGLVIPCYNEAKRIDIGYISRILMDWQEWLTVLFVDDGSTDETGRILGNICIQNAKVLSLKSNSGKAEAVRQGLIHLMNRDDFDLIGYWDADMSTPLETLPNMLDIANLKPNLLAVIGSRVKLCGRDINRNFKRHYVSRIFVSIVNFLLDLMIYDTQCGAKIFKPDALAGELNRKFVSKWIFDIEILLRIRQKTGMEMSEWLYEYPLEKWTDVTGSKLNWTALPKSTVDLIKIFYRFKNNIV